MFNNLRSEYLLVGGCPRSGTTPLEMLLNSDPRVFVSSEQNLLKLYDDLYAALGRREKRKRKLGELENRATSPRENFSQDEAYKYTFTADILYLVLRDIFYHLQQAVTPDVNPIYFGDKLPEYFRTIDEFRQISFPFRYIHITRNPFDVVNSMKMRVEMSKAGKDWWNAYSEITDMIAIWNEALQFIVEQEDTDDCLHVQYEDLIFNYDHVLGSIENFLGVNFDLSSSLRTDPEIHFQRDYLDAKDLDQIHEFADIELYKSCLMKMGVGRLSLENL